MATKRTRYTAGFKFKVALEATKELKTRSQVASEFGVHPTQVSQWKKELVANGSQLFERARPQRQEKERHKQETDLYEQIGRLNMELEWLKKKAGQVS